MGDAISGDESMIVWFRDMVESRAAMRAELATLRTRLAEAEKENKRMRTGLYVPVRDALCDQDPHRGRLARDVVKELSAKLAEAEKDTRLLDWLDANATYAIHSRIPGSMGAGVVRWRPGHDEAIDARKVLRDAMEHHAALAESEES
jgi:hypothetical protein